MKVLAFNGSPRKNGNTKIVLEHALKAVGESSIQTEIIDLCDFDIKACTGCNQCKAEEDCPVDDDLLGIYDQMKDAQGIIMASPVYFSGPTPILKAFIDRTGYIARNNGHVFKGKAGGPIAVAAREGGNFTIAQIAFWYYYNGLTVPGSFGNVVFGEEIGDVLKDTRGLDTVRLFGQNLARLIISFYPKEGI